MDVWFDRMVIVSGGCLSVISEGTLSNTSGFLMRSVLGMSNSVLPSSHHVFSRLFHLALLASQTLTDGQNAFTLRDAHKLLFEIERVVYGCLQVIDKVQEETVKRSGKPTSPFYPPASTQCVILDPHLLVGIANCWLYCFLMRTKNPILSA